MDKITVTAEQRVSTLAWIAALRSGKYAQGKNFLMVQPTKGPAEFCCLGVDSRIAGLKFTVHEPTGVCSFIYAGEIICDGRPLSTWFKWRHGWEEQDFSQFYSGKIGAPVYGTGLTYLNDHAVFTFPMIADCLQYFVDEGTTVGA